MSAASTTPSSSPTHTATIATSPKASVMWGRGAHTQRTPRGRVAARQGRRGRWRQAWAHRLLRCGALPQLAPRRTRPRSLASGTTRCWSSVCGGDRVSSQRRRCAASPRLLHRPARGRRLARSACALCGGGVFSRPEPQHVPQVALEALRRVALVQRAGGVREAAA